MTSMERNRLGWGGLIWGTHAFAAIVFLVRSEQAGFRGVSIHLMWPLVATPFLWFLSVLSSSLDYILARNHGTVISRQVGESNLPYEWGGVYPVIYGWTPFAGSQTARLASLFGTLGDNPLKGGVFKLFIDIGFGLKAIPRLLLCLLIMWLAGTSLGVD
jgi:hypothetical protein